MKEKKNQSQLFGFFLSAGKKKKYPRMDDGSVPLSAGGESSAANRAVSRSIVGWHDNLACSGQSNSKSLVTACVGAYNSVSGKKKDVVLVNHYVLIDQTKSTYKWGFHFARPAIVSQLYTGIGMMTALDGGLTCNACIDLCARRGGSNSGFSFFLIGVSLSKSALNVAQEML